MQEIAPLLGITATAAGLVIAGINIAKGKKGVVGDKEFESEVKRLDGNADEIRCEVREIKKVMVTKQELGNALERVEKRTGEHIRRIEEKIDEQNKKIEKVDTKIDAQSEIIANIDKNLYLIEHHFKELKEDRRKND